MSIYVIPTVPAFHIGRILEGKEDKIGYKVMYPEGHEKYSGRFYISGGECYCRYPRIRELQGHNVEVVHLGYSSKYPVNDACEFLRQTLSILTKPTLADGTRLERPAHIHLHLLSFAYGKQDSHWVDGEDNRARQLIEEFLEYCDSLTIIAPHFQTREWGERFLKEGRVEHISPYDMLLEAVEEDYPGEDIAFMSPGKFARFGNINSPRIKTHRVEGLDVEIDEEVRPEDYRDRITAVVDDISLTGTTALRFLYKLHELGARKKILALPHIGTVEALERLIHGNGYDKIYTTNSCDVFSPRDYRNPKLRILDISPLLIDVIKREYALPVE